jgi:hypothetical protein
MSEDQQNPSEIENNQENQKKPNVKRTKDSNEFYHSQKEYVSSSTLKSVAKRSVFHHLNSHMTSSEALTVGSAFHTLVLEPHLFDPEFFIMDKFDRRTKTGKQKAHALESEAIAQGKDCISRKNFDMITSMKNVIQSHDVCSSILTGGEPEVSVYVEDFHGIKVRVRPDYLGKDYIVDLKSCQDASPKSFNSDIYRYGWKIQAAFYADVLGMDKFYFLASEKKSPYACQLYLMSEESMAYGRKEYMKAIELWKEYLETGIQSFYHHPTLNNGVISL